MDEHIMLQKDIVQMSPLTNSHVSHMYLIKIMQVYSLCVVVTLKIMRLNFSFKVRQEDNCQIDSRVTILRLGSLYQNSCSIVVKVLI